MKVDTKLNLTTAFLLPLLGIRSSIYKPYLISSYLYHEDLINFETEHIFIVMKYTLSSKYKKLQDIITSHKNFKCNYDLDPNGAFQVYVIGIPEEFIYDYDMFLKGKYSRMSIQAKTIITDNNKFTSRIFNRDKDLRFNLENKLSVSLKDTDEVWSSIEDSYVKKGEIITEELIKRLILSTGKISLNRYKQPQ